MRQYTETQFYLPPVTPVVLRLMAILTVSWLLIVMASAVGGNPASVVLVAGGGFDPLQIITHPYYVAPASLGGFISLAFDLLILFFFGSELERQWGSSNFLKFFLYGILGGTVLTLLGAMMLQDVLLIGGIDGAISAMLLAYAILWPERPVLLFGIIPVKMKYLITFMWIFIAVGALLGGRFANFFIYLGGALAGTAYIYYYARRGRKQGGYGPVGPEYSGMTGSRSGASTAGPGLTDRVREYFRKRRLRKKQAAIDRRINVKEEVDRLLEKISKEGIDSLSRKEKAFLDKASKEF